MAACLVHRLPFFRSAISALCRQRGGAALGALSGRGGCGACARQANRVYLNRGRDFVDAAAKLGWQARGTALVDPDNDGDLDVVVTRQFAPASIYRNDAADKGWVGLLLEGDGVRCNRDAAGTRVSVEQAGDASSRKQVRELHMVNGFSAQSDRRMVFGFGGGRGAVEATIHWCGRSSPERLLLESDRYHHVRQRS